MEFGDKGLCEGEGDSEVRFVSKMKNRVFKVEKCALSLFEHDNRHATKPRTEAQTNRRAASCVYTHARPIGGSSEGCDTAVPMQKKRVGKEGLKYAEKAQT